MGSWSGKSQTVDSIRLFFMQEGMIWKILFTFAVKMKKITKYRILILLAPLVIGIIAAIAAGPKDVKRFYDANRKSSLFDLKQKGNEYAVRGETDSAMASYSIIINAYSESMPDEDKAVCAAALNNVGYLYFMNMHDFAQAYYYLIRALGVAEECGYTKGMADIYLNMGNVFMNFGNPDEAYVNYRKAAEYALAEKNYEKYLICYANILPTVYIDRSAKDAAANAAALDSVNIPGNIPLLTTSRLLREACRELDGGNSDKADSLLEKAADKVDSRLTPERFIQSIQDMRAKNMGERKRYTDAARIYRSCADMASAAGNYDLLGVSYYNLADCYELAGMHDSAVYYRNKRHEVEDSLYGSKKYGQIKDLQASFRMKKTDEEIKELVHKRDTQRLVIAIVSAAAVIVLILLVLLILERRRLRASNEELFNRVEDLLRAQDQLRQAAEEDTQERKSLVDNEEGDAILKKVLQYMDSSPEIYTPGFSIDTLCAAIDSKTRYVSYVINEKLGKNFSTLLSEYRIREACRRLSDPAGFGNITIEGVGLSLGFRSRSNFAAHFKKQTGLSPNEFLKIAQKKLRQPTNQSE